MLLNVGCGDRYAPGWYNVDHVGSPHRKDDVVDITKPLPWARDSILHAYMGHVLEHITLAQARTFLRRLRPLTRPIGQVLIVCPDVEVAMKLGETGQLDRPLDGIRLGGCRWDGDEHKWEPTARLIVKLLNETGWTDVRDVGIEHVAAFWPVADRGPRWQCAITARSA